MEIFTTPPAPQEDEFNAAFQTHRDERDGGAWQQHLAKTRRPAAVQTLQDVQALVAEIAPRYGVDPRLVESVIGLESGGNPLAVSQKGAQGVMQLMPGTAQRFGVRDPLDPEQNIEGGIRYLAFLKSQFPGRTDLQLAGYHAGEGAVRNAGYAIPQTSDGNMTTQQYVQHIMGRYQTPQGQDGAQPSRTPAPPAQTAQPPAQAPTAPERVKLLGTALPGVATPAPVESPLAPDQVGTTPGMDPLATPFPPLEQGLVESRPGRFVGAVAEGAVGMVKGLFHALVAGQQLVGLDRPNDPTTTDPMGAEQVAKALDKVQQAVEPRTGEGGRDLVDKIGAGLGSSLISIVPGFLAQGFLRGVSTIAPAVARMGGAATSGVMEAAAESGSLFEQMVPVVGEQEAAKRALNSFAQNVVLVTATDRLGIFGDQATLLRRGLAGVVTNAAQEEMQYDVERRQLWVPADHKAAEALQQQGWVKAGERLIKPYAPKEAAEAMLVGAIVGGPAAAAVGLAAQDVSTPWQNLAAREREAAGGTLDPHFSIMNVFRAAQNQPAPQGVDPEAWQRWGHYLKDLLPQPTGGPGMLASERGSISSQRLSLLRQQSLLDLQRGALERGGAEATQVIETLGGGNLETAQAQLQAQQAQVSSELAALPAEPADAAATEPIELTVEIPPASPLLSGGQPTLRGGAEGVPQEHYRTPSGDWVIPRKNIPLTELELKDFIGEMKGIQLEGEELQGELRALISPSETGIRGLQNNVRGVSLQEMAEIAQQHDFIRTADKEALLEALDRSVNLGHKVYSMQATGRIPLVHDPHVRDTYQAVLDAVELMGARTEEQVAGVRPRREVHQEARDWIASGQSTLADILEVPPNIAMNDVGASAMMQQLYTIAVNLGDAADAYLQNGARIGSQEEASLQQTMALLAQLDPIRLGVSAAQARGLGILNDPLSGYTQYLNALHKVLASSPNRTMAQIAKKIVAARPQPAKTAEYWQAHPEELALAFADMQAVIARFAVSPVTFQLEADTPEGLLGSTLSPEEKALVEAAYAPTGPPRTVAEWNTLTQAATTERQRAAIQKAFAEHQAMVERFGATALPYRLEADTPETLLGAQLSPEEQTLVQEAYNPQGPARTADEWYAMYRTAYHERWQRSMADLRTLQAELRQGYAGRPADMPAGPNLDPARPATGADARQMTLLDEYQGVQQALTDLREGRATEDQAEALLRLMEPWTATQDQLTIPTLKAALQSTKPGFEEYFLELWFNALLSSPTTHATNFLSNLVTATWAVPERFVAEQFSHGRAGGVARGETAALLYGFTHGIQGAWAGAVRSWKARQPVSGIGRETFREPAWTASNVGLNPESGLGQFADFFFEYIGFSLGAGRTPGRALMAADEFFHLWNYYGELNALAYRDAVRQGYEGRAFASHVEQIVSRPTRSAIQQASKDFAVMQTFQKPIEPGSWGAGAQWAGNLRLPLPLTDATFPVGRVLLPFIQTPVNIANYAMERTLMAPLFASYQADITAGQTEAGRARADMAHAKMTLGTVAMVAAAGFVLSGRLVGRGPEDPELRAIWRQSHEEYSFRVPFLNFWVSTRWLGPAGMLLNFVADAVQIAGEADTPLYVKLLAAPTYSFLKNIGNQTFMSQLNDFFDAMWPGYGTSPKQWMKDMQRWVFRQGATLAQPSSFLNTLARAIDPAEKQATEFMNAVYSRIPGWGNVGRSGVPSRRTLGGEKVLYGWGFEPEMLANTIRAYSPLKLGDGMIYPADLAILENKMSLNSPARSLVPHALPQGMQAQGFTEVDLQESGGLRLTDQQYERYQVLAGGNQAEAKKLGLDIPTPLLEAVVDGLSGGFAQRPPGGTRSLDDYADWLVKQPEFLTASPGPDGGKETMLQQAVRTYRMVGLQLLLAQDEPLRQRYEESQMALQTKQLPLGERQPVIDQMRQGYRAAAPRVREELGLRVGGP